MALPPFQKIHLQAGGAQAAGVSGWSRGVLTGMESVCAFALDTEETPEIS